MEIIFRTPKLAKTFNSMKLLQRVHGKRMAQVIATRLAVLNAAGTLSMVPVDPPERRHQLKGDRDEQFAVDLVHPRRLVFEVNHEPVPRRDDGGIDTDRVTSIRILEVRDYH